MLAIQPLRAHQDLTTFDSGEPELDDWLRDNALKAGERQFSRTFVLVDIETDTDAGRVVGYYSLVAHVLQREEMSKKMSRGLPRQLPAVLLAKLAVDRGWQGRRLGEQLLGEAITRVVATSEQVGIRYLVVDALHEQAATFYERYGFTRTPTGDSLRLLLRVSRDLLS